jgi:hypothetical protein
MLEVNAKNNFSLFYDKSILEDGVEFIGLINKQGKMENMLFKNDINLTKEKKEMFSMGLRLQSSMLGDFDSEFGSVSYTLTEREKLKFVSILAFPYIVLAVIKKNIDHIGLIKKINKNMRKFEKIKKWTVQK